MNKQAPAGTSYRLLFLGRHGEGDHNVAEAFYGTKAWDVWKSPKLWTIYPPTVLANMNPQCHWAALDGNETTTWADAHLTPTGINQALGVSAFWSHQLTAEKMPLPQSYYVSPLDRALHTAQLTFSTLPTPPEYPFKPTVKELLREANGIHTCDRRSSRTYIATRYPTYSIETGFTEEDLLWVPDLRESPSALTARLGELLDDIFSHDESTFISMTSHGGAIAAILRVVGHRPFSLRTGAVIPVLVMVERVSGEKPKMEIKPWTPKPTCSD